MGDPKRKGDRFKGSWLRFPSRLLLFRGRLWWSLGELGARKPSRWHHSYSRQQVDTRHFHTMVSSCYLVKVEDRRLLKDQECR